MTAGDAGPAGDLRGQSVAIIGLGLMGGSLGQALGGFCERRVGFDAEAGVGSRALSLGVVDEVADSPAAAVQDADIVVLAAPVGAIIELVPEVAPAMRYGALLTDLGSTKVEVLAAMEQHGDGIHAVGGHPMCGSDAGGIDRANGALFLGATWVLTPSRDASEDARDRAHALARTAGAVPLVMRADEHDVAVAFTSHLPYALGGALARACIAHASEVPQTASLAAGGFRDATRLAAGDPDIWTDILLTNRAAVSEAIVGVSAQLDVLRSLLDAEDADAVRAWARDNRSLRKPFLRSARPQP